MNKMKQEFEDSKQVLVKEHKEILQQLKVSISIFVACIIAYYHINYHIYIL